MTHSPEDMQALLDAIDGLKYTTIADIGYYESFHKLVAARERLRPKPEMERVLDAKRPDWWQSFASRLAHSHDTWDTTLSKFWSELVTLTMRPVQEQTWSMPDWDMFHQKLNEVKCVVGVNQSTYEAIRVILSMSEEIP
jgi:hypothetical protein